MKRISYLEKHMRIYQQFQKCAVGVEEISSNDCQKSKKKSFTSWNNDISIKNFSLTLSLSLLGSTATHRTFCAVRILFFFNILRRRETFAAKQNNTVNWVSCFASTWSSWCFNFSWIQFKDFKKSKHKNDHDEYTPHILNDYSLWNTFFLITRNDRKASSQRYFEWKWLWRNENDFRIYEKT